MAVNFIKTSIPFDAIEFPLKSVLGSARYSVAMVLGWGKGKAKKVGQK